MSQSLTQPPVPASSVSWHRGTSWGATSGLIALMLSTGAAFLEIASIGTWPAASDPSYTSFLTQNRTPILAQSLLFVFSAAAMIWFLGYVRARLLRAEGAPGTLSSIAFGAGLIAAAMNISGQAAQIVLTLPSAASLDTHAAGAIEDLCLVTTTLADVPLVVMFAAIAALSLGPHAYPAWLGWIAVAAAAAALVFTFSLVPVSGPLSPLGWLTNLLRLVPALWYIPAIVIMIRNHPAR